MSEQTTQSAPPPWLKALAKKLSRLKRPLDLEEGRCLLEPISIPPEVASAWTRFDPRFYTRNSIFKSESAELLIMGWLGGQTSPLHNHKGSICVLKVLAGEGIEIGYDRTEVGLFSPRCISRQKTGFLSASVDADVHQVGNDKAVPLVTLHLYSPPLYQAEWYPQTNSILFDHKSAAMNSNSIVAPTRETKAA